MKSEDGTGGRHALRVLKEMWDCHPTYFIQLYGQVTSVICLFHYLYKLIHILYKTKPPLHQQERLPNISRRILSYSQIVSSSETARKREHALAVIFI